MNAFWNFFLERRQFTTLVISALVVAGVVAVLAIPKENAPEVVIPVAVIQTTLRGASAADTAKLITKEIEKEVGTVENLHKLTSSSREGISVVVAEFDASANLDKSIQDVKDAVERLEHFRRFPAILFEEMSVVNGCIHRAYVFEYRRQRFRGIQVVVHALFEVADRLAGALGQLVV